MMAQQTHIKDCQRSFFLEARERGEGKRRSDGMDCRLTQVRYHISLFHVSGAVLCFTACTVRQADTLCR